MAVTPPGAPAEIDKRAIEAILRDYFEGWYDGDTARMDARCTPIWSSGARERRSA